MKYEFNRRFSQFCEGAEKGLKKKLEAIPGKHPLASLQQATILGT
jgi:hypothetical protein